MESELINKDLTIGGEQEFERLDELFKDFDPNKEKSRGKYLLSLKSMLAAKKGDRVKALEYLTQLKYSKDSIYVAQVQIAAVYAILNEKDKMYLHLENGLNDHEVETHGINFYAAFDDFKEELRFQEIIRKMGIPYYPD